MKSLIKRVRAFRNARRGEARIAGIRLPIDTRVMSPKIQLVLGKGAYEQQEAEITAAVVKPGETIVELGAGLGFVSTYLRKKTPAGNIVCVEANPDLVQYIAQVHERNDARDITILNGVVLSDVSGSSVPFYCRRDFWMSSMESSDAPFDRVVETPALDFSQLLSTYQPSILTLDIEGGELDLLTSAKTLDPLRAIVAELHPGVYGSRGVSQLTKSLERFGFVEKSGSSSGRVRTYLRQ